MEVKRLLAYFDAHGWEAWEEQKNLFLLRCPTHSVVVAAAKSRVKWASRQGGGPFVLPVLLDWMRDEGLMGEG